MNFSKVGLVLRGMVMGIAEVIPGVSGGTIAFITGIYQTLLESIKAIDHKLIGDLLRFRFSDVWSKMNGAFLFWLFAGMGGGILLGVFGVSYLLENFPEVLWALFFGLVLASVPLMLTQVKSWNLLRIIVFVLGVIIAVGITSLSPTQGNSSYLYLFMAGAIAISALVLPGISGSFMLVIMGLYTTVVPTLKSFLSSPELSEFTLLAVFGLGCLTGLMTFSRLISAAFNKYKEATIAILSGFMLGSLNKIWPWRNPTLLLDKKSGDFIATDSASISNYDLTLDTLKIIKEQNVLPADYFYEPRALAVIVAFVLGLILIYLLYRTGLMNKSDT